MQKISVVSLGCSKNLVDSEIMMGYLRDGGYTITPKPEDADVIIVNTCGFIEDAKKEAINTLLAMAEYKKGRCRALIATGCFAKRYADVIASDMPEVDGILGTYDYPHICDAVASALEGRHPQYICGTASYLDGAAKRVLSGGSWAYLKIAEGCDNRCHYCAIPLIRGGYVSRSMESLLKEAEFLHSQGITELVLTAQDTTRYGEDTGKNRLIELLAALEQVGFRRIRLLYTYPSRVSKELLEYMDSSKVVCRYLDLPIQHTEDRMLAAMNRHYRRDKIEEILNTVRDFKNPWVLRTTIIVGFPSETPREFASMLGFLQEHPFDLLGAFTYSPEDDTVGAKLPHQTRRSTKQLRYDSIMLRQGEITNARHSRFAGSVLEVLTEGFDQENGCFYGRTRYQAPEEDGKTFFTSENALKPGDYTDVLIDEAFHCDLYGRELKS